MNAKGPKLNFAAKDITVPYSDAFFAPEPTRWTRFLRQPLIYQAYHFVVLALKMMRIVVGGHS